MASIERPIDLNMVRVHCVLECLIRSRKILGTYMFIVEHRWDSDLCATGRTYDTIYAFKVDGSVWEILT